MFKPVYAPSGSLLYAASAPANVITLSASLYSNLVAVLGEDGTDHTYALLADGVSSEVVAITQLSEEEAVVSRGQDGTTPVAFGAGTTVTPIIPSAAIAEMIADAIADAALPASLSFEINEPHTVEEDAGVVTINIAKLPLTSLNSTIDVTTVGDGYGIDVQRGAFGCCPEDE